MSTGKKMAQIPLKGLLKAGPVINVATMAICYVLIMLIQWNYYSDHVFSRIGYLEPAILGCALSLAIQAARLTFASSGASLFMQGNSWGWIPLLISLGLTCFLSYECTIMAELYADAAQSASFHSLHLAFQLVTWFGFILEIVLIVSLVGSSDVEKEADAQEESIPTTTQSITKQNIGFDFTQPVMTNMGMGK